MPSLVWNKSLSHYIKVAKLPFSGNPCKRGGPVYTEIVEQVSALFQDHVEHEKLIWEYWPCINIRYRSYVNNPISTICSYKIVILKTKFKIKHTFKIKFL